MPVFARISTADPVEAASIIATTLDGDSDMLQDVVCICPTSNSPTPIDGVLSDCAHVAPVHFQGHLSSCPFHLDSALTFSQMKQSALLKQQQRLQQQKDTARRRDPFEYVRLMPTRTCHLYPGSKFQGRQESGPHSYDVMVDIKDVNLHESTLCGYLHIKGLTEQYPELTTFFDAEIIGPEYSFLTKKWDASEVTDEEHWTQFEPFEGVANMYKLEDAKYDYRNKDYVFMRWKEHFLVPDHRVEGIIGASFAGFYYICYNKQTGQISGYYYHHTSDK
ncbi:hypothetical protein BGZ80_008145 [Entomortierella chlamydospora]|uniref:Vacuolar import and degradation protein n=1 Tax=Entomortierella chlamydospora TaxID=101097 RepID=A0A9P6MXS5_9FUNG|nr:hypothetical protein BGZ80_008145 [Entomortierella chlamydospora]